MKFTLSERGSLATLSRVRVHSQDTLSGTECAHLELGLEVRGHRQGGNQCIEVPLYVKKIIIITSYVSCMRGGEERDKTLRASSQLRVHFPGTHHGQSSARQKQEARQSFWVSMWESGTQP